MRTTTARYMLQLLIMRFIINADVLRISQTLGILGKIFQLVWNYEVSPDSGTAQRSTITGEMKITIPKLYPEPERPRKIEIPEKVLKPEIPKTKTVDYRNIVSEASTKTVKETKKELRKNDENFIDNDDVPPLL